MSSTDEQLVIEPVAAPLSRPQEADPKRLFARFAPTRRAWWFGAALAGLGGVLAFVFVALPEQVDAPVRAPGQAAPPAASATAAESDAPPPYQALQMQRVREQAQQKLNDFVALQLELEDAMNVGAWGAEELAAAQERANAGDALFLETRFEAALLEYAAAVEALQRLTAEGSARFDAAIEAGHAALDARDLAAAQAAFERAGAIRPADERVVAGLARAKALPEVARLLRESERARLRDDVDAAHELLLRARRLDPATSGLSTLLADVAATRQANRRKALLSRAFAALGKNDHAAALRLFDDALQAFPNDAAALAGKQQAEQARTLAAIDDLRASAAAQVRAEQWDAALASYDKALAIDPALQFARAGREVVDARVALVHAMARVIEDPSLLSSDAEFEAAQATLASAAAQADAGARFAARRAEFEAVLARAAVPVPLVLLSDNATEVTIHKVGAIGAFERRELALRPGRYVIVGSRDGCRDARKEIVLAAGMAPVDIRCAERI